MADPVYDIEINGIGYSVKNGSYQETGRAAILARTQAEAATGELDFGLGFPYPQRSWLLGEQQYYTHEYDEQKAASLRRYQEGHGVDVSRDGRLTLLPALSLSKVLTTNPTTCPMCTDKTGGYIYAFPAGAATMHIFNGTTWTTETITGATAPILDCVNAGAEIWVIDSAASGSRVLKRSSAGVWTRISVVMTDDAFGYSTPGTDAVTVALDTVHLDTFEVPWDCHLSEIYLYCDGDGAGAGDQVLKAVVYSDDVDEYYPDVLLGTSDEVTVVDGAVKAWVKFTFSPALDLTAGNVSLGVIGGANTNTVRIYKATSADYRHLTMADTYAGGAADPFGAGATLTTDAYAIYAIVSRSSAGWPETGYDDATAIIYTNGEHYILTPDELYGYDAELIASQYQGGSVGCSYAGAVFWSDGSNRVYRYNSTGAQLIMEDLPTGFQVQSMFAAQSRLWICGVLPNGDAGIYWYQAGQYGVGTYLESAVGASRNIRAGAGSIEHVIFADSRYTSTRHYAAEGGWSHYLEYGTPGVELSGVTIPYKGLTVGAGHVAIALATGDPATQGIYVDSDLYVDAGWYVSSAADLQMPAHSKAWSALTVQCLPIRSGERIGAEYSIDGGRLWSEMKYLSLPDQTEATFAMVGASAAVQHRLTLYPPAGNVTAPEVLAVVERGNPIVRAAKQWSFIVNGGEVAPTRNDNKVTDNEKRIRALIDLSDSVAPVPFRSIDGRLYTVVVRPYIWQPVWDQYQTKLSMTLQVTLDQVEI
jgi:hypothetical protein